MRNDCYRQMTWRNVGFLSTAEFWVYTVPFIGDYVRIAHNFNVAPEDLPYGFTGLIAQAYDFDGNVELYNVRKLYPFNENDIFPIINPFPDRPRKIAIRGQRRYETPIKWGVSIDVWEGIEAFEPQSLMPRIDAIEEKIDLILSKLDNSDGTGSDTPTQAEQELFFLQ